MFIWIDNRKYITAINKKFIRFFFMTIISSDHKNEIHFSEINYHVHGY